MGATELTKERQERDGKAERSCQNTGKRAQSGALKALRAKIITTWKLWYITCADLFIRHLDCS